MPKVVTGISAEPLDAASAIDEVSAPECGGIGVFVGTVRREPAAPGHSDDQVVALEYDAHPEMAEKRLEEIAAEATTKWDVHAVAALHRIGRCELGEPTVVVACAAPHRADALEACRWIIDTLKDTVPIWKKEVYTTGSAWIEGA